MLRRLSLTLVLLAFAGVAQAEAWKQGYSRQAQQVLMRGRGAAGGAAWNYLRGWHETGREGGVPYEAWYDPIRYGMRVERRGPAGLDVRGFNGLGAWRITPAGVASGTGDPGPVGEARSEAFFAMEGFYFSGRFDAAGRYLGPRRADGKSFEAVEVKPYAAPPRELWFDRSTGLLSRIVARVGGRTVITQLSDYRKVGPVRVAFRAVTDDGLGGRTERIVESVSFTPPDRALFSLPRPMP
ncbi:MAG: hypothetical protein ACJ798_04395 [Phenylobacterium sp.]